MNSPVSPASLAGIKLNLPKQRGAYYDGKWHEPKNGRYVDTPNPATSESLGEVEEARERHLEVAQMDATRLAIRERSADIAGAQAAAKVDALSSGGMDDLEIPAFLRKQAD